MTTSMVERDNMIQLLDDTVNGINDWCYRNDLNKPDGHFMKLVEELGEIAECLNKNKLDKIGHEIADVFILTAALAFSLGIDLALVASEKFAIVDARPGVVNTRGQFVKLAGL